MDIKILAEDSLNVSLKDSKNRFGKFNSFKVVYNNDLFFEKINGEIFGLPIGGDISLEKIIIK